MYFPDTAQAAPGRVHVTCLSSLLLLFHLILQQRVAELELQFSNLEKENVGLQSNLKDCHVLLVASKIDPGEFVPPFSVS